MDTDTERYLSRDDAVSGTELVDLPDLIKCAWDMALIFPEQGDEIIADLMSDAAEIISKGNARVRAAADARAQAACDQAEQAVRDRAVMKRVLESKLAQRVEVAAETVATGMSGGLNPNGWFVYLLWPERDAKYPLYVGRTQNILERPGAHQRRSEARRAGIGWVTFLRCVDETAMIKTESDLIRRYLPPWNIAGIPS